MELTLIGFSVNTNAFIVTHSCTSEVQVYSAE